MTKLRTIKRAGTLNKAELHEPFGGWIYRALNFLVVSCPCALVISVPLSFFGGIGAASRNGILVKGIHDELKSFRDQYLLDEWD